jgi:two-component SAPR family response regulator
MMYPNSVMAYERSLQVVSEGLRIAEKSGIHILDPTLFAQGIYTSFSLGDMAMASEFLQKLGASLMGGQRNTIGQYHFITAWYNLLLGNVSTSLMHAEKALNLVSESGTPFPEFLCRLLMAQVLHETKKYEQALTHLSIAGEIIHRLGTSMFEVVYQLFSAQFAMDKGEEKDCLESLSKAMTLGKKQEFKTIVFIWRKPVMSRLCAKDGEALRFSGKGQKKPVEMLKAIIAFGGRDVNEDQLMDCLWPEAAGDTANLSFRTTLHRLRKLAGCEEAIQCGERRLALDPRFCWMDVMAFQRMTKKIEDIWKEKRPEDFNHIIDLSEKAAGLYKGDFLSADAALPWTYTTRERLRNRYVRLVKRMGRCCEETGQGERALECYQKALEADNLQEEFYRAIMLCYEKMGNHTDALRTYDRCRTALQTILGVEPSPETEELHRRLRRL